MATVNPFDLLGDVDSEDPSQLVAAQQLKVEPKKAVAPSAKSAAPGAKQQNKVAAQPKLPTKPLPPTQAVRESKPESARGGRGGGRGYGRGRGAGGGSYRDSTDNEYSYGSRDISASQGASNEADAGKPYERRGGYGGPRGPAGGGRRGGFSNGEGGEGDRDRPRRPYDRRSGTGQGSDIKREGSGRGNWGTQTDELAQVAEGGAGEGEKGMDVEKPSEEDAATAADGDKEASKNEVEEKEPEDKEMTLEEYEKILEEKRKALQALKTESRKVDVKEFESMQQLSNKKTGGDDIFIKLSSDKDKRKEAAEKEERAKKSVSINEFLKPAGDGERYYGGGGRGRGRGRGSRGGYVGGSQTSSVQAPSIEDPAHFPTLGGK